ncbi:c-type cytochrome [Brumimicrobium aurantiacum]|uniref:Cytochrome c domain-containing protein n=1 Tax=Brumimicrobium aurantiacum TaxID=1737063 RepID=A0A3E1F1T0_9FLAO|nr:c-type cytochrome [Brumimicrobium aurantiacum]RFC55778.1 hypothetical protein DXU93_02250 [Brumimicrobium aurantiacum]
MKKNFKAISTKALALTFGIGTLFSCVSDKDSPGLEWMPDMYRSPAVETYVDYGWVKEEVNPEAVMKQSAKHPPLATIPYQGKVEDLEMYLPYHRKASSFAAVTHGLQEKDGWRLTTEEGDAEYNAAAADKNPIQLTEDNQKSIFSDGKELYEINCAHCHGEDGDGKGSMVQSGAYAGVPDYSNLKDLPDGQLFYSIYYGKGMMGAHAPLLNKKEIWTVVHYINKLRFEDYGAATPQKVETDTTVVVEDTVQ